MKKLLRRRLNIAAFLMPHRPRINDPAEEQFSRIERSDLYLFFGDPVTQTLTGAPAVHYKGETITPQRIVTYPRIEVSPDLQVGVSTQQFPSLPSRRGAARVAV